MARWPPAPGVNHPGTFLADARRAGGAVGVSAHGIVRVGDALGVRYDLAAPSLVGAPGLDAVVGGAFTRQALAFHAGLGVRTLSVETAHGAQSFFLPTPNVGAAWRGGPLRLAVDAGFVPALLELHARGARAFGQGSARPYAGVDLRSATARFVQTADRRASRTDVTAQLELGLSWGSD